ncbi:unnamed protein product [Caenorhabditis auriculariae]|uniref:Uncharacterized protein n=1 Tax=Caenorhabditis auriculariae TaxID=2777116 RepID=A0A8S1GPN1_9PELO|nr:unnamed protein product [Caenorhabditis auriculariae]
MFSSGSSRRPLIRSNSSYDRPPMRNWPLFVFLIGLVVFFYAIFIFQAQYAELKIAHEQINSLIRMYCWKKVTANEKSLNEQLSSIKTTQEECSTSLRTSKLRVDILEKENREAVEAKKKTSTEFDELKIKADDFERNNTALTKLLATQESLITHLNQSVAMLQNEISEIRKGRETTVMKLRPPESVTPAVVSPVLSEKAAEAPAAAAAEVVEQVQNPNVVTPAVADKSTQTESDVKSVVPPVLPKVSGGDYVEHADDTGDAV